MIHRYLSLFLIFLWGFSSLVLAAKDETTLEQFNSQLGRIYSFVKDLKGEDSTEYRFRTSEFELGWFVADSMGLAKKFNWGPGFIGLGPAWSKLSEWELYTQLGVNFPFTNDLQIQLEVNSLKLGQPDSDYELVFRAGRMF